MLNTEGYLQVYYDSHNIKVVVHTCTYGAVIGSLESGLRAEYVERTLGNGEKGKYPHYW